MATAVAASLTLAGCSDDDDPDIEVAPDTLVTRSVALTVAETEPMATGADGTGNASFTVDTSTGAISGSATVSGTTGTPTMAHIHMGAVGVAGDVVITLESDADGLVWSAPADATLDEAGIASFNAGELYVNVHTEANPSGELRGQLDEEEVMVDPPVSVTFPLTVAETVPGATAPDASGEASFTVDTTTGAISGSATVMNTTGTPTMAHIHVGAVGVAGDVVIALEPDADSLVWSAPADAALDAAGIASFSAGELYVNVHTDANPSGELRGQLVEAAAPTAPAGSYTFTFVNTSATQPMTPPVVVLHSSAIRVYEVGQPANGGVIDIAENGMLGNLVEAMQGQLGGNVSAVDVAHPDPDNIGGPLLPGATSTLTLSPVGDDQVMSLVSMVVCTNDGFSGIDSRALPDEETTLTAAIYDAGSETNVTTLNYFVPPCGGGDDNLGDEENGAITAHPGQTVAENADFDFAAGTELLQITVTPN